MAKDVEQGKVCALIIWIIWIVGLIWFLVDEKQRHNPFTKFWFKQSLILIIFGFVIGIISIIPLLGWIIYFAGVIFMLIIWIIGLVKIIQGKTEPIPLIGKLAVQWFKF
ncbi:hypothetical protein KY306_03340 [Candidatus Woesearchaeota archaeon]|nr:hypothetical protein [Candidatus Woesearchaeota archaeon]